MPEEWKDVLIEADLQILDTGIFILPVIGQFKFGKILEFDAPIASDRR
jgi:hypothetical protein